MNQKKSEEEYGLRQVRYSYPEHKKVTDGFQVCICIALYAVWGMDWRGQEWIRSSVTMVQINGSGSLNLDGGRGRHAEKWTDLIQKQNLMGLLRD